MGLGLVVIALEHLHSHKLYRQNGEEENDENVEKQELAPGGVGVFLAFRLFRAPAPVTTEPIHLPLP